MPIPIRGARVREVLLPYLGSNTLGQTALTDHATEALRRFSPHQDSIEALAQRLADMLFGELYACLGPRMTLQLDDGRLARVLVADIPDIADGLLGVLFDSLPDSEVTLDMIRDYALRATSLSAMRALLTRFGDLQSPEEEAILRRIIRDNYPPERYRDWLPTERT